MILTFKSCGASIEVECCRVAQMDSELEALSVVCEAGAARALKWALTRDVALTIHGPTPFQFLIKNNHGYHVHTCGIAGGKKHLVALSKRPGFIACASQRSLFAYLKRCHTTPLIIEWMPAVGREMLERGMLRRLRAYGCEPAVVMASTADLDNIVTQTKLEWP